MTKELWDAIHSARASSALGRLNQSEIEDVVAALAALGWQLTKTPN